MFIKIRKPIVLLLCTIMMFSLTGCGNPEMAAEKAFDTMMQAFQSGDLTEISAYYDLEEVSNFALPQASNRNELIASILDLLKQISYEVTSVEKSDNSSCRINVTVTTVDLSYVMDSYIDRIMNLVSSEEYQSKLSTMSQDEYQSMLAEQMIEILSQNDFPLHESELSLTMVNENGVWKAGQDKDDFFNSLFNNLPNAINSLA